MDADPSFLALPFLALSNGVFCGFWCIWGLIYIIMFLAVIVGGIFWVFMLIDVIKRQDSEFPTSGSDQKTMWLLIVVLTNWLGALIYYFMVYKKMGAAK